MEAGQVVDATVVEDDDKEPDVEPGAPDQAQQGTALVLAGTPAGQIIRAEDPDEIIAKATQIANSLKKLIDSQDLAKALGGKRKHVEVGGWQAAGTMLGALGGQPLHAETEWSRIACLPNGEPLRRTYDVTEYRGKGDNRVQRVFTVDGYDWEAKVKIKTPDGTVVGTAEALCSRTESTWADRADPAVKSMAETRAESRAYRRAIGWIAHMAGYNPTPAEEMNGDEGKLPSWAEPASEKLTATAKTWVKYIAGGNGEGKALWESMLPDEGAPMPAIVAMAICLYGGAVEKHRPAPAPQAEPKAAPEPDPAPDGQLIPDDVADARAQADAAPAGEETGADIPPGKAWIRGEDGAPDDARVVSLSAAVRICRCPGGFEAAEKAPRDKPDAYDDNCPLRNHGIPF